METTCDARDNDCDPLTLDEPDGDGDGATVCTDCDDADPGNFPGNPELCDGVDNDCDLVADNALLGSGPACAAEDCAEVLLDGHATTDTYWIAPLGPAYEVRCDMDRDDGGWTLVGSLVNDLVRNWATFDVFTDITSFGALDDRATADFKSEAWSEVLADDILVVTDEYAFAFRGVFGGQDLAAWVATEYDAQLCSETFVKSGADWSENLAQDQAEFVSLLVRPRDTNATCFPGSNENSVLGMQLASCCWANGLGNCPTCQAVWQTHDHSILTLANVQPQACTPGTYPCNDNGWWGNQGASCYDTSCKAPWVEVYVR